jgi:hypothetical protein
MCMYIFLYVCIFVCMLQPITPMHVYVYMHVCICMYMYVPLPTIRYRYLFDAVESLSAFQSAFGPDDVAKIGCDGQSREQMDARFEGFQVMWMIIRSNITYIYSYTHPFLRTYRVYTYIHTFIRTYIHTYTHTHIPAGEGWSHQSIR